MLEIVGKGDEMEYYYLSKYPIRLCNDYIKHSNVYDRFIYTWEEEEGYYLITFKDYRNSIRSLNNSPKPTFKVIFRDLGNQTGIEVQFLRSRFIKTPFVATKDIDKFWEIKLDAKRIKQ